MDREKILKAGRILSEVKKFAKSIVRKDILLLEIAEKIEEKIKEFGGEPAFPVNLGIDHVTAHYTPSYSDETRARGLLKVDIGVHIDGWIADSAFSVDLEGNDENERLIEASQNSLNKSLEVVKKGLEVREVGKIIQNVSTGASFSPIVNLGGHSIGGYELHAGITVPNVDDGRKDKFEHGLYAIEPFVTTGSGRVYEGSESGIYELKSLKPVRSPFSREILNFIQEEYKTLPFASRWIVKKFGVRALLSLRELERNGNLHQFNQLIESSKRKVAQAEETVFIDGDGVIVTSE